MDIEKELEKKLEFSQSIKHLKRKDKVLNIFNKRFYISNESIHITNYIRKTPLSSFNPGALLEGKRLYIFPRMIFDYYTYNSSIGVFSLDIEDVLEGKIPEKFDTRIILWGDSIWEFGHGVEDPRIWKYNDKIYMLYTGSKHYERNGKLIKKSVLGMAEVDLNDTSYAEKKGYFKLIGNGRTYIPECKDSAFIEPVENGITMLLRFHTKGAISAWRGIGNIENLTIDVNTVEPVLFPMEWEEKVGWSTNVVKIEEDKYLVGWHAVLKEDLSYKNGFAFLDRYGRIISITDYLLSPEGLIESYGDRALVIFGDGLLKYKEYIIWIGGISDYAIGIFITTLKDVLNSFF